MKRFDLSDAQAEAILELKLRHLARLEEIKIRGEQEELAAERDRIEKILGSQARLKTLVRKEIMAAAEQHGDDRRSRLVERPAAQALDETQLISSDPVTGNAAETTINADPQEVRSVIIELGIRVGETTPDGKFSLVRVECLGSCGTAPMFQLNDDYHEDLTLEKVDELLDGLD